MTEFEKVFLLVQLVTFIVCNFVSIYMTLLKMSDRSYESVSWFMVTLILTDLLSVVLLFSFLGFVPKVSELLNVKLYLIHDVVIVFIVLEVIVIFFNFLAWVASCRNRAY